MYHDDYLEPVALEAVLDLTEEYDAATEALKKKDRDAMPESAFALPKERKYPIDTEESVKNGIKYFRFVPKENRKTVAAAYIKAIKKFKIDVRIAKGNPFIEYYPQANVYQAKRGNKGKGIPKKADLDAPKYHVGEKDRKENAKKPNDPIKAAKLAKKVA